MPTASINVCRSSSFRGFTAVERYPAAGNNATATLAPKEALRPNDEHAWQGDAMGPVFHWIAES